MKELNFEQMAAVNGGGTECPGGNFWDMPASVWATITVDTFYGVTIMRDGAGRVMCY